MVRDDDVNPDSFAARLRIAIGIESVNAFAQRACVPEASVRGYLRGASPRLDNAMALAKAAGVSLEWLAFGNVPMRSDLGDEHAPEETAANLTGDTGAADVDLMSKIGELVTSLHEEMGIALPTSQVFRIAARKHNEVVSAKPSSGEVAAMLKLLETQLRSELLDARKNPGTGKRSA